MFDITRFALLVLRAECGEILIERLCGLTKERVRQGCIYETEDRVIEEIEGLGPDLQGPPFSNGKLRWAARLTWVAPKPCTKLRGALPTALANGD